MNKQRVNILAEEFQAIGENVLVQPANLEKEETTAGGIIIKVEENTFSRPTIGKVISIGQDVEGVEIGDEVMWPSTDGIDFEFDDGHHVLIRVRSVLGIKKIRI